MNILILAFDFIYSKKFSRFIQSRERLLMNYARSITIYLEIIYFARLFLTQSILFKL
jgi:hypothetical protein